MSEFIQRLLASKLKREGADRRDGTAAGQRWAQEEAEWIELERLAEEHDCDFYGWDVDPGCWIGYFIGTLDPSRTKHPPGPKYADFYHKILGTAKRTEVSIDDYMRAFWGAAVTVFKTADKQIRRASSKVG